MSLQEAASPRVILRKKFKRDYEKLPSSVRTLLGSFPDDQATQAKIMKHQFNYISHPAGGNTRGCRRVQVELSPSSERH